MRKHVLLDRLMDGITFLALIGSLAHALFISLHLPVPFSKTLAIVLLYFIVLSILSIRLRVTLPISAALVIGIWLLNMPYAEDWLIHLTKFLDWVIYYPQGLAPYDEAMIIPFVFLVIGIISLILYISFIRFRSLVIPLVFGVSLLGAEWFLGHISITPYIWVFAFSIILIMASKRYRRLSGSVDLPDYGLWLIWTVPFAVVAIISVVFLLPKDTSTLKWQTLEDIVEDIREKRFDGSTFTQSRQPFRLSSTEFSGPDNELGGPIKLESDIVLEVQAPFPTYLRGSILNHYTGSSWKDSIDDRRYNLSDKRWSEHRDRAFDVDESLWSNRDILDPYIISGVLLPYEMTIKHVGIKTSVLFNAQFTKNIKPEKKNSFLTYFNSKSETFTSREIKGEESYVLEGMAPIMNIPQFQDILNQFSDKSSSSLEENGELTKQEYIIQHYTQLPDALPSRVVDLALTIVEDTSTSYEKAIKIQSYLKENYSYTLDTPYTPSNRDFVDYFLFDLEEGYCTYFATAMAVMGRSVGLPTRYIEGFSMSDKLRGNDVYHVRKSDAHAWVEIYFPHLGWLPFDPTPRSQEEISTNQNSDTGSHYEEYWDEYIRDYSQYDEYQQSTNFDLSEGKMSNQGLAKRPSWTIAISLILIGLLLFLLVVLISLWYHQTRHKIQKYADSKKLMYYYDRILWLLRLYGFPPLPGETPYAYAKRVDAWLINKDTSMTDVTRILVEVQFASLEPNEEQVEIVAKLYGDMERDMIDIIGLHVFLIESIKKNLSRY